MGSSGATPTQATADTGNSLTTVGGVETWPRISMAEFPGVSGRLWLGYVTPPISTTISRLGCLSGGTGNTASTLGRLGLFTVAANGDITLVARTAVDATIGNATFSAFDRALDTAGGFPASIALTYGRRYAFGLLIVAGTAFSPQGVFVGDSGTPPLISTFIDGQADIAAGYVGGALTPIFQAPYLRARS